MIQGKCPICGTTFRAETVRDRPSFPFCTERCKLIDLGRWIDQGYAIADGGSAGVGGEEGEERARAEVDMDGEE